MHIKKRYLDSGYIDMESIIKESDLPFIFFIGGKGAGKKLGKKKLKFYALIRKAKAKAR